jgi:hypothetical protein
MGRLTRTVCVATPEAIAGVQDGRASASAARN